jgi:hypothetical protein
MMPSSFLDLLHRYLFFTWLFRDASSGNLFERAAALRYNAGAARWLPLYLWRWVVLSGLLFALGSGIESGLRYQALAAVFYVPASMGAAICCLIASLIARFKALARQTSGNR